MIAKMSERVRNILIGVGSVLDLLPAPEPEPEPLTLSNSIEEGWRSVGAALAAAMAAETDRLSPDAREHLRARIAQRVESRVVGPDHWATGFSGGLYASAS